ncbi:hypothetical protein GO986_08705 [Deinococcus sp. HMF7620]|uniref:Uncharacterized protein n=1 Tax=Deinococcus arboris TaxID=2682977 RepID=A0A7C9M1N6_9DEIO|nr:hypothetical protein [Deinococcus arboris]MVN86842.1 hypothetical protein [Deinococcus arboris]
MTTQHRTYGIYSLEFLGLTSKDVREIGWVHDIKWAFTVGARPERKFELDYAHVLFGAADSSGLKLEICPRMADGHLPGVMVATTLQGNLTTVAEGLRTKFTTRVSQEALEQVGLTSAVLFEASCSLECTVSNQPTLEEQTEAQIQEELDKERQLQADHAQLMADMGAAPLLAPEEAEAQPAPSDTPDVLLGQLGFGQLSQLLQQIGRDPGEWSDPNSTNDQDAAEWRALLAEHWPQVEGEVRALLGLDVPAAEPEATDPGPVPPRVVLEPKAPGEDLPFELPDTDGAAD